MSLPSLALDKKWDELIETVKRGEGDVNARLWAGRTALHLAADSGHVPAVQSLLAEGAAVDAQDQVVCALPRPPRHLSRPLLAVPSGGTPADFARLLGRRKLADLLRRVAPPLGSEQQ
mmetsp:Transcript_3581/g.11104  ORF Transcript_3581/g.11104 Transcript_3581/m.11104 type:complete len:118 (+) Transcript_3581:193-546(+)